MSLTRTLWLLPLLVMGPAQAEELRVTFGSEHFSWREYWTDPDDGKSYSLEETGPRYFVGFEAENAVSPEWTYGLRGKLYTGRVDYDGYAKELIPPNRIYPHQTDSDYSGWSAELDFTRRFIKPNLPETDFWGVKMGLGYDNWDRSLQTSYNPDFTSVIPGYTETYGVGYGRLGAVYSTVSGWTMQGGVKLPLFTREDVGDVTLKPKPDYSLYASMTYRLDTRWSLGGYFDSYRFNASDSEVSGIYTVRQPKSQQDSIGFYLNYRF